MFVCWQNKTTRIISKFITVLGISMVIFIFQPVTELFVQNGKNVFGT